MMNNVFKYKIRHMLEVYREDMTIKTDFDVDQTVDMIEVFAKVRKHNMRLNPKKCMFGVWSGKFLNYYLVNWGIEANLDKCWSFM